MNIKGQVFHPTKVAHKHKSFSLYLNRFCHINDKILLFVNLRNNISAFLCIENGTPGGAPNLSWKHSKLTLFPFWKKGQLSGHSEGVFSVESKNKLPVSPFIFKYLFCMLSGKILNSWNILDFSLRSKWQSVFYLFPVIQNATKELNIFPDNSD